jgi:methionine-rich copper-binding protein CopC
MMQCGHSTTAVSPVLNLTRRSALFAAVLASSWLAAVTVADAHARLDRSTPAADSRLRTAPQSLSIVFTQNIEPAFSAITVTDARGARVDKNDTARDGANGKALRVSLTPLRPGTYTVHWRVLSVDSHKTEGDFTFSVVE